MTPNIYLDYHATTPVDHRVLEAMLPFFSEHFGNASSGYHRYGWDARECVEHAREQVARSIGVSQASIYFTSGATEAINLGLRGYYEANKQRANHIITCATEHSAVLETCTALEQLGARVTKLGVDAHGQPDLQQVVDLLSEDVLLVCIMLANNETGTLADIQQISDLAHAKGVPVMSDITQAVGKMEVGLPQLGVDIAAFSAHKVYGPKGVGALYVRPGISLAPQTYGGGHERNLRAGTLNVPGIVGFGKACELASKNLTENVRHLGTMRDKLENELVTQLGCTVNGDKNNRLPSVTNLTFPDLDAERLLRALSTVAASRGSACKQTVAEPSHVLRAMGLTDSAALGAVRFSVGLPTTDEEITLAIDRICNAYKALTQMPAS
ncbi:cysteine desulfurase family protein [Marinoscillum furvescens]|uniref:cysteine desulfurase n=1 Tax=Marinoscillum furvescens DSM 4134 TaxID=1122208 RepID=A0A3D9KXB8_MARFU|nr:cysteine desulfurase family protein [Marinoscillum furvescens]RED92207.1 cysteine desulfurase IscS [Marinoscillum furvescens DSM 4134]